MVWALPEKVKTRLKIEIAIICKAFRSNFMWVYIDLTLLKNKKLIDASFTKHIRGFKCFKDTQNHKFHAPYKMKIKLAILK